MKLRIYEEKGGSGYVVQGTTRLRLFLAGVSLNDVFNELNFIAGTNMTITPFVNTATRKTDLTFSSTGGSGGGVESVTGLDTDNTDPANPVVKISVDGTTITGAGTPEDPLVSVATGTGDVVGPASAVDSNFAAFNITTGKLIKDSGKKASDFQPAGSYMQMLTATAVKTTNYSANANEFIPVDTTSGNITITLPTAPADGTLMTIDKLVVPNVITVTAGGTDRFNMSSGNTSVFLYLRNENFSVQYQASTGIWLVSSYAAPYNFATVFPGIDAMTPIDYTDISINTTSRILTINNGDYFNFFTDGVGKINKFRKTGAVNFPAFTDTSGTWYFYFDSTGTAVTTQTAWSGSDFPSIATVYRIVWNSTLVDGAKLVAQYIEYHQNTIPSDTHRWEHSQSGTIWMNGFTMTNNALVSGAPNSDGRNTTIALTTGTNSDENLSYTVTNNTSGNPFTQDLGNITPASLNATNSALFKVFTQDAVDNVSFLPATRFPFAWNSGSNRPETINSTGTRTVVPDNRWFVYFIYGTSNPITGDAIKVISYTSELTSLANAEAVNWIDIQNTYPIIGNDNEIRPLYRVIFYNDNSGAGSYPAGCKYSVIRETQDLRKSPVTSTVTATGSIPASSVTFVPTGSISSTNVQSALQEIDTEKVSDSTAIAYAIALG